jgi:hypothetical protein
MNNAGRMTTTARRDTGACFLSPTEKRGSGVAYRCVMTFVPGATISIGSLFCFAPWASVRYLAGGLNRKKSQEKV